MEKDYVFFSTEGLSSTSAAHLRDLAASQAKRILEILGSLHFVNRYIQLIGTEEKHVTLNGLNNDQVRRIPELVKKVIRYHSFEAWVNEAIEAKDRCYKQIKNMNTETYIVDVLGEELPVAPVREHVMTEDEYVGTLNIKERNLYYHLVTTVAAVGKLIHANGSYTSAITEVNKAITSPVKESLNGRDTLLNIAKLSADLNVIDEVHYQLQNFHREHQAQLNGLRENINKALKQDEFEKTDKFRVANEEYQAKMKEYSIKLSQYKQNQLTAIEKWKIVIPQQLEDTYKELTTLGK